MKADECTLYSGAASGAEAEFGAAAERHGVEEINFSFDGHPDARRRGIHVLSNTELRRGDVSLAYVSKLMHRTYPDTTMFRKLLQSIWHQIHHAQAVYVIGKILGDQTVKGGTGWGAEFAKLCNKPLWVFDQDLGQWCRWVGDGWASEKDPVITHPEFAGTGTRFVDDRGRAAINELFQRSFG